MQYKKEGSGGFEREKCEKESCEFKFYKAFFNTDCNEFFFH